MLFQDIECPQCQADFDPALEVCAVCHAANARFKKEKLPKSVLFLHPASQLGLFFLGFAYVGMLAIQLLVVLVLRSFSLADDTMLFKTLILSFTYVLMAIGLFAIPLFTRRKLFLSKFNNKLDYLYGVGYAVTIVCLSAIVNAIITIFYQAPAENLNQEAAELIAKSYPILAFFIIGIIGPLCEELTYRVGLYSFFRRINKYLAVILTAVIFALIHFEFGAEDMAVELAALPVYLISGIIFSIAYEHRGPACSMTAHVAYNMFAFLMIFMR
ncbi:MAG: CPBP family intramembrane metalloprotease [Erysipelotrichia bacterium]|nr:CPBP family intramembrane metalloprotease [Erysipelotrichia bacterium]